MEGKDSAWVRGQKPPGSFCERVARTIYNPREKSFLGRTAKGWGILLAFYLVFYAVLALLFGACMVGLMLTLDDNKPTHIMERSLIGINPGVTYRPLPEAGTTVYFNLTTNNDNLTYVKQLDEFFDPYKGVRWYYLHNACNSVDNYGFPETPCFFIKINKIFGWKPDFYDHEYLPDDMPEDLIEYITSLDTDEMKQVWISCWEENSNLTIIEYPWGRGLADSFYPYKNQKGYLSPIVAVKLTPPVNKLIKINCRAWAKNISYRKSMKEPLGLTSIQLFIADSNASEIYT